MSPPYLQKNVDHFRSKLWNYNRNDIIHPNQTEACVELQTTKVHSYFIRIPLVLSLYNIISGKITHNGNCYSLLNPD